MQGTEWLYCVASKARCGKLSSGVVDAIGDRLRVFVDSSDAPAYAVEYGPAKVCDVGFDGQGIVPVRRFITAWARSECVPVIVMADDDITEFRLRKAWNGEYWELKKCDDPAAEIDKLSTYMEKTQALQIGFGQVSTAHWSKETLKPYQHCSDCYLLSPPRMARAGVDYDPVLSHFEDFDLTAQIISRCGLTAKCFAFMYSKPAMNSNPGGCACYDRQAQAKASCLHLLRKWGADKVKCAYSEAHRMMEPKFTWRKFLPTTAGRHSDASKPSPESSESAR